MNDSEIIKLFFDRDESAVDRISDKYGHAMHTISFNILGNEQDAEECVNDAYLALWYSIPPEKPDPLYPFVCRITRNVSLTKLKYNTARKRHVSGSVSLDELEGILPSGKLIDEELDDKELTRILNGWLEELDSVNRYVFMRKYWYADRTDTIAARLGISSAAVYIRLGRLRKKLFRYLKERGVTI